MHSRLLLFFFTLSLFISSSLCLRDSDRISVEEILTQLDAPGNEKAKALLELLLQKHSRACDEMYCKDPDCGKNVTQLITSKGYICEDHYALSSDGYYLSIQHIPSSRNGTSNAGRPAVFLQHGLEDASHTWVINEPYQSLAFILADAGFDVWLGNNRGNTYSNRNTNYNYDSSDFWDFSWDEMASIDVPTQINYVLQQSNQAQLFYIGHSQGTLQGFTGFQDPTVASKVKLFIALAPVYYVGDITTEFIRTLAALHIDTYLEMIGWNHFLVQSCWLDNLLDFWCDVDNGEVCQIAMCAVAGCNPTNINTTRYDVYMQLDPAGTSVQNMNHWGQMVRKNNCCKYDFLTRHENEKHYGQAHPPCYDLSKMAAPVALFSGGQDKLADVNDVARLISELNPSLIKYSEQIEYYEHMDFVWGIDAYNVIYPQIISLINQYS